MKKRIAIIIPAITAVLALLCFVLLFVSPTRAAKDEHARKRAAEIWNSVPSKGGTYATKVMIGVHTLNNGGTLQLNTVSDVFTGSVSLNNGVLTFSSDTKTSGSTYPTIVPNGALKVVLNGGDPRLQFDDDGAIKTYSPLLITTNATTYLHCEKMFTTNGDIVLYNGNGSDSTYSNGNEYAELTLDLHPNNTGAENGVVGIHSGQKAGLAIKGTECHNQGYEIILGGTTIYANATATAQFGIIDNQSGSITFCQTGAGTVTNNYNQLYSDTNATHSAVRIAASAKADSCVHFKNIGNLTITANKGNAVRNHCDTTASFVEKSSPYTYNGVNYTRKYNAYSNSVDTIVFDNTGSVTLETKNDFVMGWNQQCGVLFNNNGNVRVKGSGQVTVKETLKTFAIGPAEKDSGGCGIAINVNNNENNPHAGLYVEGNAKLTVIAIGDTSAANDTAMKAEFDALTRTGSYAEQTLQTGRERLAATWVNYGQVNVSGNAQYASYAKRTGTSTAQCSALVIKIGKYVQSGSPNVLFYQENTSNNGIGMEIQSGNNINAALYDNNGTEHVFQLAEGPLPDHTETIRNNAGLIVSGGQLEVKSSNWGVRINNYNSLYGQDVRISDGIVLIKGNGRTIEGLSTPSTTQFQNAYHCNAIGNVDLGSKAYPSNMGSSNAGLAYIGDINEEYTPNTLLSSAGINATAAMGKTDGKTVIFPANATEENVYYTSDGAKIMAKQGNTHTANSAITVQFTPPNMKSYVLIRENNGTAYMLGGNDGTTYTHTKRNSAAGTISYTPNANGNDALTINNVSGVQEIEAPTGSLTVTVSGTNTLNNPQDGNIRVTYADGALNLRGNGTLNATAKTDLLYAWGGGITIAGNGTGSSNLKLNLTGNNRLIYNPNGTDVEPITMTDLTLTMDVNQAAGYGLVHHGRGDVALTRCTVNADLYENGESTTLFQIGDHGALIKTDYSSYTPKVTIHDTNITLTSSQVKTAGRSSVLLLKTLGGKLDVTGTSRITSDGRLFHIIGANPAVNFTDNAKVTSTGSGGDTINVSATKSDGTMDFTVTDNANLLIENSHSCAIRLTADHPDYTEKDEENLVYMKSTIRFIVEENAVVNAYGRGQVLYIKTHLGTTHSAIRGTASLTLKNTGLKTVPDGYTATTNTLYSALRVWANSRTADGTFTIQDNASVSVSCDDKEVLADNLVSAFDIYDFGDSGHRGTFTIKDNARLDVDGSHAFIMYDANLRFEGGKTTARANETNGSVFYGKGAGNNKISFLSGSEFYGTGNYGIYEENIGDTLEVQKGAKLYLSGTVKAQNNYAADRTTLLDGKESDIFYSGCAPSNQDKYIITGTMENDLEVTIYTFGNVGGKNTHVLSWNGNNGNNRCFDSANGVYKNKTNTTQVYMVAPGQVVFNNINRGISNGSFTNTYNFDSDGTVKQIKFDKSDATVELIGDSRIWDQASGGSGGTASSPRYTLTTDSEGKKNGSQYLIGSYASGTYGHTLTITAGKSEYEKGGGRLSLQGVNYVVCTRDNLTVEGYACLSIETSTSPSGAGNAFHSARAADDSYYLFRGHAQVYVGAINDNWENTGNRTSGVGMYMAGGTLHLQVLENSAFNLNTSSYGIYLYSDTAFNKNLQGSNVPTNLLLEIGGNSTIDVTSAGHSIALQTSCNATAGDTVPDYTTVMNETIRLFGNATLNLQNVGATSHEIVYYNHSSGDNLLEIRDYSRLNVNRPDGHTSNTTAIALLQYSASKDDKAKTITAFNNGAKDNSVYILDGATVTITGTGNAANLNYGIELTNHSLGKNTAIIQGTGEKDKPTVNITAEDGVKPVMQGIHLSGGYLNQSAHESNTLNISNAEINIRAENFGITLSGGTIEQTYGNIISYVSPNNITIQDATITLSQYNEANNMAFEVRGSDNVMSISGNTNLTMNHNHLGLYLEANGENGNLLNISDNTTIVAQKNTATYAKNHNIALNSTGLGDNVMNVMQTENGAPNLTLNDTSMYAIYLKHTNASTAEQNNRLTIDGENTVINVNTASSGTVPTAIYMFKEDKGAGQNLMTVNKATLNLSAHMWGIVQYQYDSGNNISAKGYNNVVLQDAKVNVNTGMTGINLDTSATGGNNLTIDNSTVTIVSGRTNNDYTIQNENYRRGIRLIDKYAGERNSLTVQNGSQVTIGEIQNDASGTSTKFYIGVELDKRGSGINEFNLNDAVFKIDIAIPQNASGAEESTYAILLGKETCSITENRLIINGDPATDKETLLDARSTGNVVAMMANVSATTQNTLLFDGDAKVNLINTHDGSDPSRHSAIFYSAQTIDFDILTTGTVYLLGKGSTWSSAAVFDNNKNGTTSDILITGTDVTVENYTKNTGDQPGVAWLLSDNGNHTMTIAEDANVTFRGRFGGTGSPPRPYGLYVSGTKGTGSVTVKDNATVLCEATSVDDGTHNAKWSAALHLKNGAMTIQDNATVYAKTSAEGTTGISAIILEENCSILIQGKGFLQAESTVGPSFTGSFWGAVYNYDNPATQEIEYSTIAPINIMKDSDNDGMFVVKSNVALAISPTQNLTQVVNAQQAASMGLLKTYTITKEAETIPATGSLLLTIAMISATVSVCTLFFVLRDEWKKKNR